MLTLRSYKSAKLVSQHDSAVTSGYDDYVRSYYDLSKLVIRDGQRATVFHVEPLTPAQLDSIDSIASLRVRSQIVLQLALRAVDGLVVQDGEMPAVDAPPLVREPVNGMIMVTPAWMAASGLAAQTDLLYELMSMVLRLSSPDPT